MLALQFAKCHRDYLEYSVDEKGNPGDLGWFYNERPNIGFLAGAAWRIKGWVAIEEYRFDKAHPSKRNAVSKGRADLFIGARLSSRVTVDLAIEAKQMFVSGPKRTKQQLNPKADNSALCRAIGDAERSLSEADVDYRCAAVFVCPELRAGEAMSSKFDLKPSPMHSSRHAMHYPRNGRHSPLRHQISIMSGLATEQAVFSPIQR